MSQILLGLATEGLGQFLTQCLLYAVMLSKVIREAAKTPRLACHCFYVLNFPHMIKQALKLIFRRLKHANLFMKSYWTIFKIKKEDNLMLTVVCYNQKKIVRFSLMMTLMFIESIICTVIIILKELFTTLAGQAFEQTQVKVFMLMSYYTKTPPWCPG